MSRTATVSVPATSANLGAGFDSLGLALELRDQVTATRTDDGVFTVVIRGEGAHTLPSDATHLIVKTIVDASDEFADTITGLTLECDNAIAQGRGLGSSAAAIVAGLFLARELTGADKTDFDLLQIANRLEGHPDNIGACIYGGLTVAWEDADKTAHVRALEVDPRIVPVAGIPSAELSTEKARGLLPSTVPYADAVFNVSRAALIIAAMTTDPSVLLAATDDRLHQNYRDAAYGDSMNLVRALRAEGFAAFISGAGPTVLSLGTAEQVAGTLEIMAGHGFTSAPLQVAKHGAIVH